VQEKHRLRVSENRVLRSIFGSKRGGGTEGGKTYIMRSFIVCTLHEKLLGL
jgi:hypothetical protein